MFVYLFVLFIYLLTCVIFAFKTVAITHCCWHGHPPYSRQREDTLRC